MQNPNAISVATIPRILLTPTLRDHHSKELLEKVMPRLEYIFDLWQDEKKYEASIAHLGNLRVDFSDYETSIKKFLNDKGAKFIGLKQRPFELIYEDAYIDLKVIVRVNSKEFKVYFEPLK